MNQISVWACLQNNGHICCNWSSSDETATFALMLGHPLWFASFWHAVIKELMWIMKLVWWCDCCNSYNWWLSGQLRVIDSPPPHPCIILIFPFIGKTWFSDKWQAHVRKQWKLPILNIQTFVSDIWICVWFLYILAFVLWYNMWYIVYLAIN